MKTTQRLEVIPNSQGFLLIGANCKYIIAKSQKNVEQTPYFLKQIEPNHQYLTALFQGKKSMYGTAYKKTRYYVEIRGSVATLTIEQLN